MSEILPSRQETSSTQQGFGVLSPIEKNKTASTHLTTVADNRDGSNKSHSIKEINIEIALSNSEDNNYNNQNNNNYENTTTPPYPPYYMATSTTAPTPRARGGHSERPVETDGKKMKDPPGFEPALKTNPQVDGSSNNNNESNNPRRKKRLLEEKARRISANSTKGKHNNHDDTHTTMTNTSSSTHQSSWVPVRKIDKDPLNRPVAASETDPKTLEICDKSVPQKSWEPKRSNSAVRNDNLAEDDDMDFSITNEWVPSEYYKNQPTQLNSLTSSQISKSSSNPPIISPYPPSLPQAAPTVQQQTPPSTENYQNLQPPTENYPRQEQRRQQQEEGKAQEERPRLKPVKTPWRPQQSHSLEKPPQPAPSSSAPFPISMIRTVSKTPSPAPPTRQSMRQSMASEMDMSDILKGGKPPQTPSTPHHRPPISSIIITKPRTPQTPLSVDPFARKSMASDMDLSDVVIDEEGAISDTLSSTHSRTPSEENSTVNDSLKKNYKKRYSEHSVMEDSAKENNTIIDSFKSVQISDVKRLSMLSMNSFDFEDPKNPKKRYSEHSTMEDSVKESNNIRDSFKAARKSYSKRMSHISMNSFVNEDVDESLISGSLLNSINHSDKPSGLPNDITMEKFCIPAIFIRKSGTSDITMDLDATREMIESTLTSSDEDLTFSSTIHNSIITETYTASDKGPNREPSLFGSGNSTIKTMDPKMLAAAAKESIKKPGALFGSLNDSTIKTISSRQLTEAAAAAKDQLLNEINLIGSGNDSTIRTVSTKYEERRKAAKEKMLHEQTKYGSGNDSTIKTNSSKNLSAAAAAAVAKEQILKEGLLRAEDEQAKAKYKERKRLVAEQLSSLREEIGARARKKMEDIPSEVSSFVNEMLSQKDQESENDSQRSSWHHRTAISVNSNMVSTKKAENKAKFRARRSSTSTLPSIGSIIPEELYAQYDTYLNGDEDEDEDSDKSDFSYFEINDPSTDDENSYETDIKYGSSTSFQNDRDTSRGASSSIIRPAGKKKKRNNSDKDKDSSEKNTFETSKGEKDNWEISVTPTMGSWDRLDMSGGISSGNDSSVLRDVRKKTKRKGKRKKSQSSKGGKSRDISGGGIRRTNSRASTERDIETGTTTNSHTNSNAESGDRDKSGSSSRRSLPDCCDCLDIRCFRKVNHDLDDEENRLWRRFKPTCGAYVVTFLICFLMAVWTGIGVFWYMLINREQDPYYTTDPP